MRRATLLLLLGSMMPVLSAGAQYVHVQPPPPVVERPRPAPGRGYVWIPGYQRWDGNRFIWAPGKWAIAPRPRAVWMPGHWDRSPNGWRWVAGGWRG
ncbi:hypothetical protein D1Y84_02680 [Acidipila sp. EB88]|nr:hypothetical protein D1Y84_02680 [Acidipila sp. EB88]